MFPAQQRRAATGFDTITKFRTIAVKLDWSSVLHMLPNLRQDMILNECDGRSGPCRHPPPLIYSGPANPSGMLGHPRRPSNFLYPCKQGLTVAYSAACGSPCKSTLLVTAKGIYGLVPCEEPTRRVHSTKQVQPTS